MPDAFATAPASDALDRFLEAVRRACFATDPLEGMIIIAVTRDGLTISGHGNIDDQAVQVEVISELARSFGAEVDVSERAEAVH
jgi:hypothetical protein